MGLHIVIQGRRLTHYGVVEVLRVPQQYSFGCWVRILQLRQLFVHNKDPLRNYVQYLLHKYFTLLNKIMTRIEELFLPPLSGKTECSFLIQSCPCKKGAAPSKIW